MICGLTGNRTLISSVQDWNSPVELSAQICCEDDGNRTRLRLIDSQIAYLRLSSPYVCRVGRNRTLSYGFGIHLAALASTLYRPPERSRTYIGRLSADCSTVELQVDGGYQKKTLGNLVPQMGFEPITSGF